MEKLVGFGLLEARQRQRERLALARQIVSAEREVKALEYQIAGLNGKRAVARRLRQMAARAVS